MAIDIVTMNQIVENVFREMLGMTTAVLDPNTPPLVQGGLSASIQISGVKKEVFVVDAPLASANAIAEIMFSADPGSLSDSEVRDALGEVANMIGGNVKGTYDGESQLSLPAVTSINGSPPQMDFDRRTLIAISGHPISIHWHDILPVSA